MRIYYSDLWAFLSKLTWEKLVNAFLLVTSFWASKLTGRVYHWGQPITLSIEPTTACNLACPECPSGLKSFTRPTGNIDIHLFKKIVDEIHQRTIYLILYFQGEPYIHPKFFEMLRYAHQKKLYTITSTNGHYLNEENAQKTVLSGLNRLIISVDGVTQETYQQYRRNGHLETVLKGAQNVVQAKKKLNSNTPHIVFQFLVIKANEHQIKDAMKLANDIGVDEISFKTAQIYDYKNGHPLIPDNEKYARYKKTDNGSYALKRKHNIRKHCWKLWHATVVSWDGRILPCCFDKDAQNVFGKMQQDVGLLEVWKNNQSNVFRKQIISSRKNISICANCTEGVDIWG